MDLYKLRYFRIVARMEHMSKAAQKLHITQPALSKTIALLEEELGGPLFNRVGRKIELNEHGRIFLEYAEQALAAVDAGMERIRELNDPRFGQRIKLQTNIVAIERLFGLLDGFRRENPETVFEVITTYTKSKYQENCDCYIASNRIHFYQCTSVPIFTEEILLGVSERNPLARFDEIPLDAAANEEFIGRPLSSSWAEETEEYCLEAGFKPRYRVICDSLPFMARLVAADYGAAFFPAASHDDYDLDGLKLLHIRQPACERRYNLSWQTNKEHSPTAKRFIQFTQEYFS